MSKVVFVYLFSLGILFSSCQDFLTARDKSSILEDDLFTNQEGVEEALYGLYVTLANSTMYGKTFPQIIDLLGQYFSIGKEEGETSTGGIYDRVMMHDHSDERAITRYKNIWQTSYKFISDVNKVLERLESWDGSRLKHEKMYRGEALGLRAYVLFDLLRMFGSVLEENRGIPYVTRYGMYVTPFSKTGECYEKIIADLKLAEQLLAEEDEKFLVYPRLPENMYDLFTSERVSHFNLYAVKATLARVYWTRGRVGDLDSAGMYAREVIESGRFPLPSDGTSISATHFIRSVGGTVDVDEAIFGLYVSQMYDNWSGELLLDKGGWMPSDAEMYKRWDDKFDYRNEWIGVPNMYNMSLADRINVYGNRYLKVLNRVEINPSDKDLAGIGFSGVNLIRVPEMYLILTESLLESSPEEAKVVFDKYHASRGMGKYEGELTVEVLDEEFRKEFVLEGQYWFRLKKRQPSKLKLTPQIGGELTMSEEKWNLFIPDEEFEYRDESTY